MIQKQPRSLYRKYLFEEETKTRYTEYILYSICTQDQLFPPCSSGFPSEGKGLLMTRSPRGAWVSGICPVKTLLFLNQTLFLFHKPHWIEQGQLCDDWSSFISWTKRKWHTCQFALLNPCNLGLKSWSLLKPLGTLQFTLEPWIYSVDTFTMIGINWSELLCFAPNQPDTS